MTQGRRPEWPRHTGENPLPVPRPDIAERILPGFLQNVTVTDPAEGIARLWVPEQLGVAGGCLTELRRHGLLQGPMSYPRMVMIGALRSRVAYFHKDSSGARG